MRFFSRRSNTAGPIRRKRQRLRRFLIENLERRLMLASDFVYDRSAALVGFNAKLTNTPTEIRLVDANTNAVLHSLLRTDFTGNVNIVGSPRDDSLTLDTEGLISFQNFTFQGGNGNDSVSLVDSIEAAGFDVTISAETITVGANQEIFTNGAGPRDAGKITLTGVNIELKDNAALRAEAVAGRAAGDITVTASNAPSAGASVLGDLLSPVLVNDLTASIKLNNNNLVEGANVVLKTETATQTRWQDVGDYAKEIGNVLFTTIGQISDLGLSLISPISGQVKIQKASGDILLNSSIINASGSLSVTSESSADSSFDVVGVNNLADAVLPFIIAIGYGETSTKANIAITGTTQMSANDDVTIKTDSGSTSVVGARGSGNTRLSNSDNVKAAVALALSMNTSISTIATSSASRIQSNTGSVRINANGESETEADANAILFRDGVAGLAVSVAVDKATVTAKVDGTVTAGATTGATKYPFTSSQVVNVADNSITLANIPTESPITRGQKLVYFAEGNTPIGGLVNGNEYVVADVENVPAGNTFTGTQKIRLAITMPLDLDASQVLPNSTQTLGKLALASFSSSAVAADASNNLSIDVSGLTAGTKVKYLGPNSPVTEENISANFQRSASGDTITRTDGGRSWEQLGLYIGQTIQLADAGGNSRVFRVKGFGANSATLIVQETNTVTAGAFKGFTLRTTVTEEKINANFQRQATGDTITRTDGKNWLQLGLTNGQQIEIIDANGASKSWTIKTINGATLVLAQANAVTNGAVTGFTLKTTPAGIGNLVQGNEYTVDVAAGRVRLRDPLAPANLIAFAGSGSGVQGFQYVATTKSFAPSTAVNSDRDTITIANHGFQTGDVLVYRTDPTKTIPEDINSFSNTNPNNPTVLGTVNLPDAPIDGMSTGFYYYVTKVDANTIRLSEAGLAARHAEVIDLTSAPVGTHSFGKPDDAVGIEVTATLDASNSTSAGTELSDGEQPWPDVISSSATNAESTLALINELRKKANAKNTPTPNQPPPPADGCNSNDSGIPFEFAGTFTIHVFNHTVEAIIGSTAVLKSGKDILVQSSISQSHNTESSSEATRNGLDSADTSDTGAARKDTEISVAFSLFIANNISHATISDGAKLDALNVTTIDSKIEYPFRVDSAEGVVNPAELELRNLDQYAFLLDGTLGLVTHLFNSQVTSIGGDPGSNSADKFVIGASFDILIFNNESIAKIGKSAAINQDIAFQNADQTVNVNSLLLMQTIDVVSNAAINLSIPNLLETGVGVFKEGFNPKEVLQSFINPFGISGQNAIGPSIIVSTSNNKTIAFVDDGAVIRTGTGQSGLNVNATQDIFSLAVSQTGAKASEFGLTASVSADVLKSETRANIGKNVIITGGGIAVEAIDTANRYGIDGGYVSGEKIGVGVAIAVNLQERTTLAYIGSETPTTDTETGPAKINVSGPVSVKAAEHGDLFALSLAGVVLTDPENVPTPKQPPVGGDDSNCVPPKNNPVGGVPVDQQKVNFTFSVGASVAVNEGKNTVKAFVDDPAITANSLNIDAINDVESRTIVIGGAIGKTKAGTNIGIGGAFAVNTLTTKTEAFLRDSEVITIGAANTPALRVNAENDSVIYSDGGGVALLISQGAQNPTNIGIGIGVAINLIEGDTKAFVENSSVTASAGNVIINALYAPKIDALTIGGAGAVTTSNGDSTNITGAGAGAKNVILSGGAIAYASNSTIAAANSSFIVSATDSSDITVDAGAVAFAIVMAAGGSYTNLSFAASVAINEITSQTRAFLFKPTVSAKDVSVTATSNATIDAFTLGGAVASGAFSGAGSGNTITTTTEATIDGGDRLAFNGGVFATGNANVSALNTSTIIADAGGFSLAVTLSQQNGGVAATGSIGIGASKNKIDSKTLATIRDIVVAANTGTLTLEAKATPTIKALSMGGAGAVGYSQSSSAFTFAGAGAGSGNDIISVVKATIDDIDATSSTLVTAGTLNVLASDTSTIVANAGGIALALGIAGGNTNINVSIGASVAINNINAQTTASVNKSTARSLVGAAAVKATSAATIDALTIAGAGAVALSTGSSGFGVTVAGAGTGSGNTINSNTSALVTGAVLNATTTLDVLSSNTSSITAKAIAGSLSIQSGQGASVAVGAAIAINTIDANVFAVVNTSQASSGGDLTLSARSVGSIEALTVGVAASVAVNSGSGTFTLAGAGVGAKSTNKLTGTIESSIIGGSVVSTNTGSNGKINLFALDSNTIKADSGGGSLAVSASAKGFSGAFAISAALSYNDIGVSTLARIDGQGTTVTADGALNAIADSLAMINATATSVAASVALTNPQQGFALALAGGGSEANNAINSKIAASVSSKADVSAKSDVALRAKDESNITAIVPAVTISVSIGIGFSIGVALTNNLINNTIDAFVDDSKVRSINGNVIVDAASIGKIEAFATPIAVSISIGAGGAGGKARSEISGHTYAYLDASAVVNAGGTVRVSATATESTLAEAKGGGAGLLAIGAMLSESIISASTRAFVDDGVTVNATGLKVVTYGLDAGQPAETSRTATSVAKVGVVAALGGSGGRAVSTVSGVVEAYIGAGAQINVGSGAMIVDAKSKSTVDADAPGGTGGVGGIGVAALLADATISGSTRAYVGSSTNIVAGSLDVKATADKLADSSILAVAIQVAGGAGGKATSIDSAITEAYVAGTASGAANPNANVAGNMNVIARSTSVATTDARGGAGGAIAGVGYETESTISGDTTAHVDADAFISAGNLLVQATAPTRTASATELSVSIVGAGVQVSRAKVSVTGDVNASLGNNARVNTPVNGSIQILADSVSKTSAKSEGGSGGQYNVSAFEADSFIGEEKNSSSTSAVTGSLVQLNTGSLTIRSNSDNSATSGLLSVGVGVFVGAGAATSSSLLYTDTVATLGNGSTVNAAGNIGISATSKQAVSADNTAGGGGSIAAIGVANGIARYQGTTRAAINENSSVISGGSISINSTVDGASSSAKLLAGSGGGISVGSTKAESVSLPTVEATIATGTTARANGGDINVIAIGQGESDANAESSGGGVLQVGVAYATSTFTPTISANAVTGKPISASRDVNVKSELKKLGATPTPSDTIQDRTDDADNVAVDLNTDTVDFAFPLTTGDSVVYRSPTPTQSIDGLTDGRTYNVIVKDPAKTLQFGNQFDAAAIDPLRDVITFSRPHNFQPGDRVRLNANGGLSIVEPWQTGLAVGDPLRVDPSAVLYVRGIYSNPSNPNTLDPFSIRLARTQAEALASDTTLLKSLPAANLIVPQNLISLPGSGFVAGQAVTYRASATRTFATESVDVNVVDATFKDANGNVTNTKDIQRNASNVGLHFNNNNIFMLNHSFNTGDAITYTSQSAPIGGLVSGTTYYVIKVDANQIRLARTYHESVGLAFDDRGTADTSDDILAIPVTPIQITANGSQNNSHSISRNFSGLQDGQTYYVINPSGNNFQLAATRGGSAILVDRADTIQIRQRNGAVANTIFPVTRGGTHALGTLGVDLRAGTGTQSLVIDLASQPLTNDHRLLGVGGVSLNLISPPPGDGLSGAKAVGGSGGGIDVAVPSAVMTITPSVTTNVGSFTAGRNATISAVSATGSSTNADTTGGGLVSVGEAHADTIMGNAPTLSLISDSSTITVGGNFVMFSNSDHSVSATAHSAGGGAIAGKIAETTAKLNASTQSKVDFDVSITAGGLLSIRSDVKVNGRSNSETYNVGPFVGADSDNTNSDRGVDVDSPSDVLIFSNAKLKAESLDLKATVSSVDVYARASATAYSPILLGVVTAYADANADVNAKASVNIVDVRTALAIVKALVTNPFDFSFLTGVLETNAISIIGTKGVDIDASTSNVSVVRDAYALAVALIPPQEARQLGGTTVSGEVYASTNALVVAGTRDPNATPLVTRTTIPQLALFVNSTNKTTWDSDVQILSAVNPELVIDASGNVVKQKGVSFIQSPDKSDLNIQSVEPTGPGQVLFSGNALVTGNKGTFTFERTPSRIDITTSKGRMFVGNIVTSSTGPAGIEPKVTIDVPVNTLEFDVENNFGPTAINITNLDPAPSEFGIRLGGVIDNPLGTTTINSIGSVYAASFLGRQGVIRTNRLQITTQGDAGLGFRDELDRIPIDIVESMDRPAFMSVNAGKNIVVGIQGLLRDPSVTDFKTTTDPVASSFIAGAEADIMLLGGLDQRNVGVIAPFGIQVFETSRVLIPILAPSPTAPSTSPRTTLVTNHFRVSTNAAQTLPVGYFGSGSNPIPVTYNLGLIQVGTWLNVYKDDSVTSRVNIVSNTNIVNGPNAGNIESRTNGTIDLTETVGDMRIGSIVSSDDNVRLRSRTGAMLDVADDLTAAGDAAADVKGVSIRLVASGEVGQAANPLDIDSSSPRNGSVFVDGRGVQLIETAGNLNVFSIKSSLDATVQVAAGSIVDFNSNLFVPADITANTITLIANNATPFTNAIGTFADPLEIDSSFNAKGGLFTDTNTNVTITEVADELYVLGVSTAENIGVRLTARDSGSNRNDIIIEGPVNVFNGSLFLTAGDDFDLLASQANASLAGAIVNINVDPPAQDPDPFGSNVRIEKQIDGTVTINGGDDIDTFSVVPMNAVMNIVGGQPVYPTYPGDKLTVDAQGAASTNTVISIPQGRGTVTTAGRANVEYFSIELLDRKDVNDPPVNALPGAIVTDVTPIVLSAANGNALSVTDADAGDATNFLVTLTVPVGTLALINNAGVTVTGGGTTSLSITGSFSAINTALAAGLRFTPPVGFTGATTLTMVSNDRGNTGTGGPLTDTDILPITVGTDLNDPPVNQYPASATSSTNSVTFSSALGNGISVTDIDAGNGAGFNVRLTIANGTLTLTNGAGITVAGNGTAATPLVLTGTLSAINSALAAGLVVAKPVDFVGSTVLTIVSNDNGNTGTGGALTDTDSLVIKFIDLNIAPVNSLPPDFATKLKSTIFSFANSNAISVSDLDAGDANNISVKLTVANGILTFVLANDFLFPNLQVDGNGTASVSLLGSLADINAALARGIRHDVPLNFVGTTTLTMVSNDNGNTGSPGPLTDTDILTITIGNDVNDPPVNSLPPNFSTNQTTLVLSAANGNNLSVSDIDAGNAVNFQVTLTADVGTLALVNASGVTVAGTGTPASPLQITGSLGRINFLLASGLRITLPNGFLGTTTLTMVSNDAGNTGTGGAKTDTDAMKITVVNFDVNDPPVNRLPADYVSDQVFTLSQFNGNAISITDPDAGNANNFTVTLTVSSGTLLLTNPAGVTVAGNGGTGFPMVLTGTLANINTVLAAGVTLTSVLPQSLSPFSIGGTTLTVTSNDAGNTGAGGPMSDTDVVRISKPNGFDWNDPPVNHLPPPVVTDQTPVVFSQANGNAIFVTDVDAGNATNFSVTFSIDAGSLVLLQPDDIQTASTTIPTGQSTLTLFGTVAKINSSLRNGLIFNPPVCFTGTTFINVNSNDAGNTGLGGPLSDVDLLSVTIGTDINDPPVNRLPQPITTDRSTIIFSAANGTALSVTDVDAGNANNFSVSLRVASGTLAILNSVNLTVSGNGTSATPLSLTGTIANINAALAAGVRLTVPNGFVGNNRLTMVSNDAGNTGSGGPLTDVDTLDIFVTQDINDAPVNILPAAFVTNQNPILLSAALGNALSVVDIDAGNAPNFSVRLTAAHGNLTLVTKAGIVAVGNGTSGTPLQLTGTLSDINAVLATGLFINLPAGFVGNTSLTILSNDAGNTGSGGPKTDEDVLNITVVSSVNEGPINLLPAPVVTDQATMVFSQANANQLSVSDIDAGNANNFQVTLSVADGSLSLLSTAGITVSGVGTLASPLQMTGTLSAINAALASGLRYSSPNGFLGTTTLVMFSNDNGNTGPGGAKTDTDFLSITVQANVNDPPVNHLPTSPVIPSAPFTFSGANGNAIFVTDVDAGNANNFSVQISMPDGQLTLVNSAGVTVTGNGTPATPLRLTGTLTAINSVLDVGLVYTPLFNFFGTTLLKVVSNDAGNTGLGGPLTDTDYLPIRVVAPTNVAPQVVAVFADSSRWTKDFRDFVDGGLGDSNQRGYPIPKGVLQQETLPWVNIDRLKVVFSEDVGRSLNFADFRLAPATDYTALGIPVGTLPKILNYSYDSSSYTATIALSKPLPAAVFDLTIFSSGVFDGEAAKLDGEWVNGVSTGNSGNSIAGGDFTFRIFALPGDSKDESGGVGTRTVNSNDSQRVRDKQNGFVVAGIGDFGYDLRADLDGSAFVNSNDSQYVRDQQNAIIFRSSGLNILQNPTNKRDVDNDGSVSPLDVLIVINALNKRSEGEDPANVVTAFLDVTGDEDLSPLDALTVINWLNGDTSGDVPFETGDLDGASGEGEASAEGESPIYGLAGSLQSGVSLNGIDAAWAAYAIAPQQNDFAKSATALRTGLTLNERTQVQNSSMQQGVPDWNANQKQSQQGADTYCDEEADLSFDDAIDDSLHWIARDIIFGRKSKSTQTKTNS